MSYLEELNEEQRAAAGHTSGPLLVVAGAGTGKTRTLTYRIRHLIESGVRPDQILAITFTNKAAAEMRERLAALLRADDGLPFTSTFHALGVHILRENHHELGLPKYFTILDGGDGLALIKEAMEQEGVNPKEWDPKQIRNRISLHKGKGLNAEAILGEGSAIDDIMSPVWSTYEKLKTQQKSLDFSDLLLKSYQLLKDRPDIREKYQKRWSHVHVDEYQDTNDIQYQLCKLLLNDNQNICAVGDSDQTIYSWRGATIRNILQFERDFPGSKVVILEQNYRSSKNILDAAHEIIRKNSSRFDKALRATKAGGEQISIYQAMSAPSEAGWIARQINTLVKNGHKPGDICILYRTNFQSRLIEEALMRTGVPYQLLGTKFFERREVKDVISYVRYVLNQDSLGDLKRIVNFPKRGIGNTSIAHIMSGHPESLTKKAKESFAHFTEIIENLKQQATEATTSEFLQSLLLTTGIQTSLQEGSTDDQERFENIKELVSFAAQYDHLPAPDGLQQLVEDAALLGEQDNLDTDDTYGAVRMMTIHAAKGLEFPIVFVAGMEQGLFPSDRGNDDRDKEEERRLCYVAFTRAKEKLYLSWAQIRRIFGQDVVQSPSEFLHDIPDHLVETDSIYQQYDQTDHSEGTNYLDW